MRKISWNLSDHSAYIYRYGVSGGTSFIVEYVSFYFIYKTLEGNLYLANSISFCLALATSFYLNRKWAFRQDRFYIKMHHQLIAYCILAAFNLTSTNVIVGLLKGLGISPLIGKIISIIAIAAWNFFIFRLFIFKESSNNTNETELD